MAAIPRCLSFVLILAGLPVFAIGVSFVLYCSTFYYVPIEIALGLGLLILGLCFCCEPKGYAMGIVGTCVLLGLALGILVLNCYSLTCVYNPASTLCVSLNRRTQHLHSTCLANFSSIHSYTSNNAINRSELLPILYSVTIGLSVAVLVICSSVIYRGRRHLQPSCNIYCLHIFFGFLLVIVGCVYFAYCGVYFYTGFVFWSAAIILSTGLYCGCCDSATRLVAIVMHCFVLLSCAIMVAFVGFGMYCRMNPQSNHCEMSPYLSQVHRDMYYNCFEGVMTLSYGDMPKTESVHEIQNVRFGTYIAVCSIALLELLYSLGCVIWLIRQRRSYLKY